MIQELPMKTRNDSKSEFVAFRLTRTDRKLAEAAAAQRQWTLSSLIRESLMNTVREDLRRSITETAEV